MAKSYGGSSLQASFAAPNFDEYLAKIEAAGNSVEAIGKKAVDAGAKIVFDSMKDGAARHREGVGKYGTDAVFDAIEILPSELSGNFIWAKVGIDTEKHPEAIHGIYQEYGDGHSPHFPDPFVRPSIDENKTKIKAAERAVLKEGGVPID